MPTTPSRYDAIITTPWRGKLGIVIDHGALSAMDFLDARAAGRAPADAVAAEVVRQQVASMKRSVIRDYSPKSESPSVSPAQSSGYMPCATRRWNVG